MDQGDLDSNTSASFLRLASASHLPHFSGDLGFLTCKMGRWHLLVRPEGFMSVCGRPGTVQGARGLCPGGIYILMEETGRPQADREMQRKTSDTNGCSVEQSRRMVGQWRGRGCFKQGGQERASQGEGVTFKPRSGSKGASPEGRWRLGEAGSSRCTGQQRGWVTGGTGRWPTWPACGGGGGRVTSRWALYAP